MCILANHYMNSQTHEPLHELTDSSTAALFSLVAWESMTIMFNPLTANDRVLMLDGPKLNPTKRRRNAGAFWRYLNKSDIDLSRFGIFKTFDPVNQVRHRSVKIWYL